MGEVLGSDKVWPVILMGIRREHSTHGAKATSALGYLLHARHNPAMSAQEQNQSGLEANKLLIIRNPAAGKGGKRFNQTLDHLRGLGCHVELRQTQARGDAEKLARAAAHEGFNRVLAAGGDGTINEVINGLARTDMPLALLPLGTANVLAHEIGLSLDPAVIARTAANGVTRPVCLGRVSQGANTEAGQEQRLFVMMAGVGFDAHAVAGVNPALKHQSGKGAYFIEALRQLAVFSYPRYRLNVDGRDYDAVSAIIANGRSYAGRYLLAPEARLEDPRLHVCLFQKPGALAFMRYGLALQCGRLGKRSDFRIVTGRKITIEGPTGDPLQADGDIVAKLPVEIEALPGALNLVMPLG